MAAVDPGSEVQSHVVLVSLNYQPYFDEMYADFLEKLGNRARVQRAKKSGAVIKLLTADRPPNAIICTDEAITTKAFEPVYDAILRYIRVAGGTCVLMGHFPNFVLPLDMKPFFERAGLPWARSGYHRTTLHMNRRAVADVPNAHTLLASYSQKAVYVKNVAAEDAWYVTDENSVVESNVRHPENVHKVGETSVALAKLGAGNLGYVGDMNGEVGSDAVILTMCGL